MVDFKKRLKALKERRQGSRKKEFSALESLSDNSAINESSGYRVQESFEKLNESDGTKYAIGAMAPVDEKSTEISKREGDRVADSLIKSLKNRGESVAKKLQGSVALDIHIKGHSDVDMLIVVTNPVNIETPRVHPNGYLPPSDPRCLINIAKDVRNKSENILPINFPKVNVDCSGNKSIALNGGSLARKVDIVPAIWFDSIKYQQSGNEDDRGIKIYHKGDHELILNYPFTHIKLVNDRDTNYSGNLKCVVRLMKNMVADMPDYKKIVAKRLSSYDLASIGYHMNRDLELATYLRLGLVEKTRSHLSLLLGAKEYRETLDVPDGSRKIFDKEEKIAALKIIANEFDDLANSIFKELKPFQSTYDPSVIINKRVS
jgi:hypothetical protein